MNLLRLLITAWAILLVGLTGLVAQSKADPVNFDRQIRPLLSDRCFVCHGPDEGSREGDLRLDSIKAMTADRGGYAVVVPGHPEKSEMIARLRAEDIDDRMPPADVRVKISKAEIDLLERWITEGAKFSRHWAFLPPRRKTPAIDEKWCSDPLDEFVFARLTTEGLSPAPQASREVLARRAALTLTGLPPDPEHIDAFLADSEPGAWHRWVDALLSSPRYGERMASDWMDVARYGDSYGYQADVHRDMWPWRDWVIRAFNSNLPYDTFATWQIAGDLLENPTRDQRLATAFNRLHRQTNEGGSTEDEYRKDYVADRTQTFGTAFLGLTMECARCHDHKFDPILQTDFYALSAFFNNIDESGLYSHFTASVPSPSMQLPTQEQTAQLLVLEKAAREREKAVAAGVAGRRGAFKEWLSRTVSKSIEKLPDLSAHFPLDAITQKTLENKVNPKMPGGVHDGPTTVEGVRGQCIELSGDNNVHFKGVGAVNRADAFSISLWMKTPDIKKRAVIIHRSRAWTDAGSRGYELLLQEGKLSTALIHFWPGNAIGIQDTVVLEPGAWHHVVMSYDGSARASGLTLWVDGARASTVVVRDHLTLNITGGGANALTVGQRFRDLGFKGGLIDDVRVFRRCVTVVDVAELREEGALLACLKDAATSTKSREDLFQWWLGALDTAYRSWLADLRKSRVALNSYRNRIPSIMVMEEMEAPRQTYLLARGHYASPTTKVSARVPSVFDPMDPAFPRNRLGLARWLTAPSNPLAARVAVNRLWQIAFGYGLVTTPDNFGTQGTRPTHPALLDQLALDFVESGWDVKAMLRRLLMSSTWRQSSRPRADVGGNDPENALLSRGPRYRLSAEAIRDQALHASGLLVERIGGRSVLPYQPSGLWKEKSGKTYKASTGDDLYRRSLYTFWKRTSPPPYMMIFDAAKRDVCAVRRHRTSTPLQALTLMNDPQFLEAARMLAARVIRKEPSNASAAVALAYRHLTGLRPNDAEKAVLLALHTQALSSITEDQAAKTYASRLLAVGAADLDPKLDPTRLVAMMLVCSTVMNTDACIELR